MYDFRSILGEPSDLELTQSHEFDLSDGATLYLLITLHSTEPAIARMEKMRAVVNLIHHTASTQEFDFQAIKIALSQSIPAAHFDAIVARVQNGILYVYLVGKVEVSIFRGGKLLTIISGEAVLRAASGKLLPNDHVVFQTQAFREVVSASELEGYLQSGDIDSLAEDCAIKVQDQPTHGASGAAFLVGEVAPETVQEEILEEAPMEQQSEQEEPDDEPAHSPDSVPTLRERMFVRQEAYEARGKSKKLAVAGVVLIALLGVSIFFGAKAKRAQNEEARVREALSAADTALAQAKSVSSVSKLQAKELIENARAQVLGVKTEAEYPELAAMNAALVASLGDVAGVYEIVPSVFSDLTLVSSETRADQLVLSDGIIRLLSKSDKRILTIELPGKRTETLAGGSSLTNPVQVAGYVEDTYALAGDGIYSVSNNIKKVSDLPADANSLLFSLFAGNLYVVDKSQNQIWRYSGDGTSFGEKKEWLTEGVAVDFSGATSMAIDGAIWVHTKSGKLFKFTQGNPQNITLRGAPGTLAENASFFTDSDVKYLYLLDSGSKALYVFEKNGELIATYTSDVLANGTGVVVSEGNNLIIVAAGDKLLSLPAKHIK